MNPHAIELTNLRTFEKLRLEFPAGIVAIVGENGAGKSTILNAIDQALFAERGELAPLLTVGEDELELGLEFEHAGEFYRVRRQYSARGRGKTTLDFEIYDGRDSVAEGWSPLTRESTDATGKLIADTLGLSRKTFRASSFLAQGDGGAFSEAPPAARKRVLTEILGLSLWDDSEDGRPATTASLLGCVKRDLRGCEDELVKSRAQIEGLAEMVARKGEVESAVRILANGVEMSERTLADGEKQLEEAQRERADAAVIVEQIRACEAELRAATDAHARAQAEYAAAAQAGIDLAGWMIELGELAADADRVADLEFEVARLRAAATDAANARFMRDQLVRDAEQREFARGRLVMQALGANTDARLMREKANHLMAHIDESSQCDRCGQTLGKEAAERAAESYAADADKLNANARQIDEAAEVELAEIAGLHEQAAAIVIADVADPAPVESDLAACRRAAEQRAALAEKVTQLTALAERREELEQAFAAATELANEKAAMLDEAKLTVVDETVLLAKVERWRIAVSEARGLIESRKADLVRGESELARIADAERLLATHHETVASTQKRVDLLKLAERAYGRDGIPALIVESAAIPQLELEANRILGELGGTTAGCRIELRTQRALKSAAEQLRETLDIVIVTPTGARAYETFSGGERTRLNLALRIALARLLAHRRGAESRLLAIDEPDGLDQAGMQALANVLRGVGGDFEKILVVSHHPDLATELEQSIVVVSDGEHSRIEVETLEPVAAMEAVR